MTATGTLPGRIGTPAEMAADALSVHDEGCCTAQAPCARRTALAALLARYERAPLPAHGEPPAAPLPRGNGSTGAHSTARPAPHGTPAAASGKQVRYLRVLAAQRDYLSLVPADRAVLDAVMAGATPAARDASRVITALKATVYADAASYRPPWTQNTAQAAPAAPLPAALAAGIYRHDGTVCKVQRAVHGSGKMYAKALVVDGHGDAHFEYAPGLVHKLSAGERMSLEQAQEFGALYGVCCRCSATLTDEQSIAAGIGPVCASKGGWA